MRVKAILSEKNKSLIWKQAWTVDSLTGTIMERKEMTKEILSMSIFYQNTFQNVSL